MDAYSEFVEDLVFWGGKTDENKAALETTFEGIMTGQISADAELTFVSGSEGGKSYSVNVDVSPSRKRSAIRTALQILDGSRVTVVRGRVR